LGTEKVTKIKKIRTNPQGVTLWDIQVSGGDTFVCNGIVIHNSYVERGTRAGIRNVRAYRRKDGSFVKAHSYFSRGQRAQHYIENPLKEQMNHLPEEFENQMRAKGFKVSKMK